ncbi:MAG: hypothetical protein IPM64_02390 [Phycisphaerales bacterium]|nr:hypothetical protein [Phycisphaerales bacterium]
MGGTIRLDDIGRVDGTLWLAHEDDATFHGVAHIETIGQDGWVGGSTADNNIFIGSLEGTLEFGNYYSSLDEIAPGIFVTNGQIYVSGDMTGRINILAGESPLTGDLGGRISVEGSVRSADDEPAILIEGDMFDTSRIAIGENLEGRIVVHGSVVVDWEEPSILISGDMAENSRLLIGGSLINAQGGTTIEVLGMMDASAAIVVDYEGWHDGDDWDGNTRIRVDGVNYNGNTPAEHIWEITPCVGDMNNDGAFNNYDIDPFVIALLWQDEDPADGLPDYVNLFPGLEYSVVYHGDVNCDSEFNNFDIAAFVDKLTNHLGCCECDGNCASSFGGGGEQSFSSGAPPGFIHGAAFRSGLSDDYLLVRFIDHVAAAAALDEESGYWSDLLSGLLEEQ